MKQAMSIKTAIIPAAGLGTRFLPATKSVPKELFLLVDRPCIHHIVDEAIAAGVNRFVFVISKEKEPVKNYFEPNERLYALLEERGKTKLAQSMRNWDKQAHFEFVEQEKPLGLGHAVFCARDKVPDEHFFVILPDDVIVSEKPVCQQMQQAFLQFHKPLLAVLLVDWEQVSRYGIVQAAALSDHVGDVQDIIEKPKREDAPSNLAVIGRYILPQKIFKYLAHTVPGSGGEIQLTDALRRLIQDGGLQSFSFQGDYLDTGTPLGWLQANITLALHHPEMQTPITETIRALASRYL